MATAAFSVSGFSMSMSKSSGTLFFLSSGERREGEWWDSETERHHCEYVSMPTLAFTVIRKETSLFSCKTKENMYKNTFFFFYIKILEKAQVTPFVTGLNTKRSNQKDWRETNEEWKQSASQPLREHRHGFCRQYTYNQSFFLVWREIIGWFGKCSSPPPLKSLPPPSLSMGTIRLSHAVAETSQTDN